MRMCSDNNDIVLKSFNKICPLCGIGNPEDVIRCIVCNKDLEETVLFLEDEFMILK